MKVITVNKKAFYDYFILEEYTAGIVLIGNEVKSLREGRVNLKDSYIRMKNNEAFLVNAHISEYSKSAKIESYDPIRLRKLLLNKKEINRLMGKIKEKGLSVVPLEMFFNNRGFVKIKIALVKGKKLYDKRRTLKEKDMARELKKQVG